MPNVLIPIANGTEEMEDIITIDVLRRAQWTVVVAGVDDGLITAARGVRLMPDKSWSEINTQDFDILMIPGGGPGVERFLKFEPLLKTIRDFHRDGKWVGAICAAPLTLQAAGILTDKKVTCHPGVAARLTSTPRLNRPTVVDGRILTSQGAGTTFEFALTIIQLVEGPGKARAIADSIVLGENSWSLKH
jgi:4-methyl-5(b-hydroxyethyl)-thiazole monophosphate biosynthesis